MIKNVIRNEKKDFRSKKGVPIRVVSSVVVIVMFAITVLLMFAISFVARFNRKMQTSADKYIEYEIIAQQMRDASDFLTEQVREFIETGDKKYADAYFTETNEAKTREKALDAFRVDFENDTSYVALKAAMAQSYALAEREIYSMRLQAETGSEPIESYAKQIQDVVLTDEDKALSPQEKHEKAHEMLFDEEYQSKKDDIYRQTTACVNDLVDSIKMELIYTSDKLQVVLMWERALILLFFLIIFVLFFMNVKLIYKPLSGAIAKLKSDQKFEITGAKELRFLAKEYNNMYDASHKNQAHLSYKATHDPLTGVKNRTGFDDYLRKADYVDTAVLTIDIDDYKNFNDTYGHEIGDRILVAIAKSLRETFPQGTYVSRIGGDEFCIILRAENIVGDLKAYIMEKIDFLNEKFKSLPDLPPVSISCGVGFCKNQSGRDALREADKAMYNRKRSGKNGISFL